MKSIKPCYSQYHQAKIKSNLLAVSGESNLEHQEVISFEKIHSPYINQGTIGLINVRLLNDTTEREGPADLISISHGRYSNASDLINSVPGRRVRDIEFTPNSVYGHSSSHMLRHGHTPTNIGNPTHLIDSSKPFDWILQPPRRLLFNNNTGGMLHCQAAAGGDAASVSWIYETGQPLISVS